MAVRKTEKREEKLMEDKANTEIWKPKIPHDEVEKAFHKLHLQYEPSFNTGIDGIKFDFCHGFRLLVPSSATGAYTVEIWDDENGALIGSHKVKATDYLRHPLTYRRPLMIRILDESGEKPLFQHTYCEEGRPVVISFPQRTVGDAIAWFAAVEPYAKATQCDLYIAMHPFLRVLFEKANPWAKFITFDQMESMRPYAHYEMGISLDGDEKIQPFDWRHQGLHHAGFRILGMDPYGVDEAPPAIVYDREKREIAEPYVCVASMATGGCKLWLNPTGWDEVCLFLKKCGYRVIDIDAESYKPYGLLSYRIPREAEDFTGHGEGKLLPDRAAMINHADFFIGLGSGLSWLAWAVKKPVVLISGFSLPFCEFHTPYRIINYNVCHGCFNDTSLKFDNKAAFWCPRQTDERAKLSCSTSITSTMVINAILRMPEFIQHMKSAGLKVIMTPDGYDVAPITETK